NGPRFLVHGTRASWIKCGLDPQESQLAAEMCVDTGATSPRESAVLVDGASGVETAAVIPQGDYRHFYAAVRDAVRGAGSNPAAQAIATTAVVEAAAQSAAEGRVLTLPLTEAECVAFRMSSEVR